MRIRFPVTAILCVGVMAWLAARYENWAQAYTLTGQKTDYYNLLIDGFQEGYLAMKAEVDPRRYSPDENVRRQAGFLMDASLYQGRYYLYFGVVPALIAFWPYAALTGHDLPPNLAVLIAIAGGFIIYLRLYILARDRHFPGTPAAVDVTNVLLLAFASCAPAALRVGQMYEVAIGYAYCCTAVLLYCLYHALHSGKNAARWLAVASLAYGLSVGCRPTFLLLGPLVILCVWLLLRRDRTADHRPPGLRLTVAAIAPAFIIGLGLMAYNHARFDSPLEFGHTYQLNAGAGKPLHHLAFIPLNLGWYYFTPPVIGPYFPYVFPLDTSNAPADYFGSEPVHGQWLTLLLGFGCILTLLGAGLRRSWRLLPPPFRQFLVLLVIGFAGMALFTCFYGVRSNRYMMDFQSILVLKLVLLGTWLQSATLSGRVWRAGYCCMAPLVALVNILISLELLGIFADTHANTHRLFAHYGNQPAAWLARMGWFKHGPLRFKVTFVPHKTPVHEALVATGTPGYKDVLFVAQYPGGHADFILYHEGHGGARSALLPIEYGRPYEIELDMGSLYPPAPNKYFSTWEGSAAPETLKSFARVTVDGAELIRARQNFYDAPPGWLHFGRAPGRSEREFSGTISDVQRLPPRSATTLHSFTEPGVWSLEFDIPATTQTAGQPLLSSGQTGAGNLLFLEVLSADTFRLGLDTWGWSATRSPPITYRDPGSHRLDIVVGPQVARHFGRSGPAQADPAAMEGRPWIHVWFDGTLVWVTEVRAFHDSFDFVGIGTNTQGFSSAQSDYAARFRKRTLSPEEIRALIEHSLATNGSDLAARQPEHRSSPRD